MRLCLINSHWYRICRITSLIPWPQQILLPSYSSLIISSKQTFIIINYLRVLTKIIPVTDICADLTFLTFCPTLAHCAVLNGGHLAFSEFTERWQIQIYVNVNV